MNNYEVGSVVTLNSGGPPMTVGAVRDNLVQLVYVCFQRQIIRKEWVDVNCVHIYEPPTQTSPATPPKTD